MSRKETKIDKSALMPGESFEDLRRKLTDLIIPIGDSLVQDEEGAMFHWIVELFADRVIFQLGDRASTTYALPYRRTEGGGVEAAGDPVEVQEQSTWVPAPMNVGVLKAMPCGDQQLAFGFLTMSTVGDKYVADIDNDLIETAEIEKAQYNYVLNARMQGDNHERLGVGRLVESIVFSKEKQEAIQKSLRDLGIDATCDLGCEAVWGGFLIEDDEVWEATKRGERMGWSLGGKAKRVPINEAD